MKPSEEIRGTIQRNIRFLRTFYGESQDDLAKALFCSRTLITQWETGKKEITLDRLVLIADHFFVSPDELINEELSEMLDYTTMSNAGLTKLFQRMIVFFRPKPDTDNPHFKSGCDLAIKAFRMSDSDGIEKAKSILVDAIDEFEESISDGVKYFPNANIIALILVLLLLSSIDNKALDQLSSSFTQPNSKQEKRKLLQNQEIINQMMENKKKLSHEFDSFLITHLSEMKRQRSNSMLADYYIALRYFLGLVDNEIPFCWNQGMGLDLMLTYYKLGNKYAERFLDSFSELFDSET